MSGIAAVFGRVDGNALLKHRQLMVALSVDGDDASGFIRIENDNSTTHYKTRRPYNDAVRVKDDWAAIIKNSAAVGCQGIVAVAHKAKTINDKDAGPHEFGRLVGSITGNVDPDSVKWLPRAIRPAYSFEANVISNMSRSKEGPERILKLLDGVWRGIFYDRNRKQVTVHTTETKPLFMCYSKGYEQVWLSSDKTLLEWILNREDDVTTHIVHSDIVELGSDIVYSFKLNDKPLMLDRKLLRPLTEKNIVPKYIVAEPYVAVVDEPVVEEQLPAFQDQTTVLPFPEPVDTIADVPILPPEEVRELPDESIPKLLDRIDVGQDKTYNETRKAHIRLGKFNWSDRVTWNINTEYAASTLVSQLEELTERRRFLGQYYKGLEAEIRVRSSVRAMFNAVSKEIARGQFTKLPYSNKLPVSERIRIVA